VVLCQSLFFSRTSHQNFIHLQFIPIEILGSFNSRPCVGYDLAASRRFRLGEIASVSMKHLRDIVSFGVGFRDRGSISPVTWKLPLPQAVPSISHLLWFQCLERTGPKFHELAIFIHRNKFASGKRDVIVIVIVIENEVTCVGAKSCGGKVQASSSASSDSTQRLCIHGINLLILVVT